MHYASWKSPPKGYKRLLDMTCKGSIKGYKTLTKVSKNKKKYLMVTKWSEKKVYHKNFIIKANEKVVKWLITSS